MSAAYHVAFWQTLFGVVAAVAATLTGLLFVALSLNLERILGKAAYRARAREALSALMILVVLSVLVLIPGQSALVLGWELVAAGLLLELYGLRLQRGTITRLEYRHRGTWLVRLIPIHLSTVTNMVAGATLLVGQYGGLYWLVPTVLVYLVWSVVNAWTLVVQAAAEGSHH